MRPWERHLPTWWKARTRTKTWEGKIMIQTVIMLYLSSFQKANKVKPFHFTALKSVTL